MKKILLLFILGSASLWGWAQNVSGESNNGPKIEFATATLDYGQISQNSDGNRAFEFTNTGNQPLLLTNVVASCGCTATDWPREPIKPGGKGKITVKYNTAIIGPFRKSIRVFSSASPQALYLTIMGEIKPIAE